MDLLELHNLEPIDIQENENDYVIKVKSKKYDNLVCPNLECGSTNFVKNGAKKNQYFWDIPINNKRVRLILDRRQRYKCKECSTTWLEKLSEIDDTRKMTIRLIDYIEQLIYKNQSFASVADKIGVTEPTIRYVFNDLLTGYENQLNFKTPKWMGVNEIYILGSSRSIITNASENTIIDMKKDCEEVTIIEYLENLSDRESIEVITMNMCNSYRAAVKKVLPGAKIVVGKQCILNMADLAVETIRKELRKTLISTQRKILKNERHVLLKRRYDLSITDTINMGVWNRSFPILGMVYDCKEAFYEIWDIGDKQVAKEQLEEWIKSIPEEVKEAFEPLIIAIDGWKEEIFNCFDYKDINTHIELLIKHINKIDLGYSFDVVRAKILYPNGLKRVYEPKEEYLGTDISLILQRLEKGEL